MSNILRDDDFVSAGFKRLDRQIDQHPPKINWGRLYQDWAIERKLAYAERLAASMNQAAAQIQDERDKLGRLCELKEQQLEKLSKAVAQNNAMLQQEVTRMNIEQQNHNAVVARLDAEVKELKKTCHGDHH